MWKQLAEIRLNLNKNNVVPDSEADEKSEKQSQLQNGKLISNDCINNDMNKTPYFHDSSEKDNKKKLGGKFNVQISSQISGHNDEVALPNRPAIKVSEESKLSGEYVVCDKSQRISGSTIQQIKVPYGANSLNTESTSNQIILAPKASSTDRTAKKSSTLRARFKEDDYLQEKCAERTVSPPVVKFDKFFIVIAYTFS